MKIASYSLDYVASGSAPNRAPNQINLPENALNEAAVIYGQPVLKALAQAEKKQMRLYDLSDKVGQECGTSPGFEQFQGVISHLASLGLVRVAQNDSRGNNLIELVPRAA